MNQLINDYLAYIARSSYFTSLYVQDLRDWAQGPRFGLTTSNPEMKAQGIWALLWMGLTTSSLDVQGTWASLPVLRVTTSSLAIQAAYATAGELPPTAVATG